MVVLLITWFNRRATRMLVHRSFAAFIYANGLLLLTVASLRFSSALLGEFVLTDEATPVVLLYNAVLGGCIPEPPRESSRRKCALQVNGHRRYLAQVIN